MTCIFYFIIIFYDLMCLISDYGIFFRQSPFSKSLLSYIMKEPSVPPTTEEDESIHDFIERRFGSDVSQAVHNLYISDQSLITGRGGGS